MTRGACYGLGPVLGAQIFFLKRGQSPEQAQSYCSACTVGPQCEEYAHRTLTEYGVWNGIPLKRSGPDRASVTRAGYAQQTEPGGPDGSTVAVSIKRRGVRKLREPVERRVDDKAGKVGKRRRRQGKRGTRNP